MTASSLTVRVQAIANLAFFAIAFCFTVGLFYYFWTGIGGPVLLASTLVPVTFALHTLDSLRKNDFYPRLGPLAGGLIALAYVAASLAIAVYMNVETVPIGEERAGFYNTWDLLAGGVMALLIMEFARVRYFELFVINIALILYAVYGDVVPGMFHHAGLEWRRIVTSMSVEMSTGIFSSLSQLALTVIGSFVLVLSALRAFGCIDSLLRGASQIVAKSPTALPQAAVVGSLAVGAVSGSGAANAVTTGSATIPAMIAAGIPRESAAAIESGSSLGGQLMPPIMGIAAFLMADFMGVSYFDVVARGYAPAVVYFAAIAFSVFVLSMQHGIRPENVVIERMHWTDWSNLGVFLLVVGGLVVCMAIWHLPPMFAALYIFVTIAVVLCTTEVLRVSGEPGARPLASLGAAARRFMDEFTTMTVDLTLLLATLSILTGALVITGVPTKIGFLLLEAASVNLLAMGLMAFVFGALLGMGLPPAPTYILTALVIAPPMIKAGMNPWAVHFFAFFLAVWGELTPPTSVVAAVTAKIAQASFMGVLLSALRICSSLFVLMVATFTRPELVLTPGLDQVGALIIVLVAALGVQLALQARFGRTPLATWGGRAASMACAALALAHPDLTVASLGGAGVFALAGWWWLSQKAARVAVA